MAAISIFAYTSGVFAGDPEITAEEAKAIAEKATNGKAISVELEKEGFSLVYEVIIINETGRYEVEIDAKDGTILEIEEDDDYEDDDDDDDDHDDDDDEHDDDDDEEDDDDEHDDDDDEEDDP
ncbi:MAG: PepSY domain-containing protein [Thermoplasmata archaeon]|nr:MAG: PepSY domain-containing protein [Thermoplasmata archaeon]